MAENDGAQMHSILLEEREKLRVTGVSDVQSFDEEQVLLETGKGMLIVRGQGCTWKNYSWMQGKRSCAARSRCSNMTTPSRRAAVCCAACSAHDDGGHQP